MEHETENFTHLMRFDRERALAFKRAYLYALRNGREQFSWGGVDWLTSYAGYVCEYLKTKGLLK